MSNINTTDKQTNSKPIQSKSVKKPKTSGVAKVPIVMQLEALECGAASLAMILAYYDKWIPLEEVRVDCGVSRDGSKASYILAAARNYGLEAHGYRYEPELLKERGTFPCIIHWNFNHFVVLNGFKGDKAIINDPAKGTYSVSMQTFDESFTGICLTFKPTEDFEPSGKPESMLSYAKERLQGSKGAIAFVILTSVIISIMGIINPAYARIFLDRLLTGENPDWFVPFLISLATLNIIQLIVQWISSIYDLRINGKMDAVGSATFMWKILHLPMDFFSQRMAGDLQQRQISNAEIAYELVYTLSPLVLESAMMIFYLVVMIRYSVFLTIIGLSATAINLMLSRIISKKRVTIARIKMRDEAKLAGTTVSGIEMIETIKSTGAENGFFEKWAGYQAGVISQTVKFAKLNQYLGQVPALINTLTNSSIILLGVYLVIEGQFTVGMVLAFQGFLASFSAPSATLINAGQTIQELRTTMERVEDVLRYPDDVIFDATKDNVSSSTDDEISDNETDASGETIDTDNTNAAGETEYRKLSGNIEIKNLTFGYSRLSEPLIKDFSLSIKAGQKIAFVGGSGCGKSTIAKLVSGLYQPWDGEILFDSTPLLDIDRDVFTGSFAVVDQEIILFEDTISNNIKMWDNSIEDFEVILAARDAQIHDDIMQRDGGYQYILTEGGKDFSGGQRQRLEIARVLAQDPTIIVLDEATSALDAKTEAQVVKAITDRGITCIVIAHRLSTIRDCDEILVMDYGEVVERGTHDELLAMGGKYANLISNEE